MENFILYDALEKSDHTVVYKGRKKGTIKFVAIHRIEKCKRCELTNTVRMIHDLNHPNIVKFDEWYETSNHLWLVIELCTGGSLEKLITQDGHLPEDSIRKFGVDLVSGLHFLHSLNIIFCDLRPSKVLFDCYGKLKYADFGLSKAEEENLEEVFQKFLEMNDINPRDDEELIKKQPTKGSPNYMAPEVLKGGDMTVTSDLWSLGCVLYEMYTGHQPFQAETFQELVDKIVNDDYPPPKVIGSKPSLKPSSEFLDLLKRLLEKDPYKRITWFDLVHHPFWEGELENLLKQFFNNTSNRTDISSDEKLNHSVLSSDSEHNQSTQDISAAPTFEEEQTITQSTSACDNDVSIAEEISSSITSSPVADLNTFKPKMHTVGETSLGEGLFTLSTRSSTNIPSKNHSISLVQSCGSPTYPNEVLQNPESNTGLLELLYHPTDFNVTPIADNPKITKVIPLKYEAKSLLITPYGVEKILTLSEKAYQKHINQIIDIFQNVEKGPPTQKRHNFFNYLGTLVSNVTIANSLVNHGMLTHLARQAKDSNNTDVRSKLSRVAALLVNSTTEIDDVINVSEPITIFTELLRDNLKNGKLRHSLLPAVGELLFLVACQESQRGESIENWSVPTMTHTIIAKCCREEGDIIVNHLAAKIIENVTTTFGHHAQKFATNEIGQSLWYLYKQTAVDSLQITVILALCRITRLSVSVFQNVLDSVGVASVLDTFSSGITRIHQAVITMFGALLSAGYCVPRLLQDKVFLEHVFHLLDNLSDVIRAKAFFVIFQLIQNSPNILSTCCKSRLLMYIERDIQGTVADSKVYSTSDHLTSCLTKLCDVIVQSVPYIIKEILDALDPISKRQHISNAILIRQLRLALPQVDIITSLISSNLFRNRIVNDKFCRDIGNLLIHVKDIEVYGTNIDAVIGPGSTTDFVTQIVSVIYTMSQHSSLLQQHYDVITGIWLRTLVQLTACQDTPTRESCLWLVAELASFYLGQEQNSHRDGQFTKKLHSLIDDYLLPQCEQILLDQDPLPSYALKLFGVLLDHSPGFIKYIEKHCLITVIFQVLIDHQHNPVSSAVKTIVKILRCIVGHKETNMSDLYEQGLIGHLIGLISELNPTCMEPGNPSYKVSVEMLHDLLDTLHGNLKYISDVVRKVIQAKKHGSEDIIDNNRAEQLLLVNKAFIDVNPLLIQLMCHADCEIQEVATKLLSLTAQLFGGECQDALTDENMMFYCKALKIADSKRQKLILRIIKRFVTVEKHHTNTLKRNGLELLNVIKSLSHTASSTADIAITSLANDILKIGGVA
ncbi:serine/threonine-protein kinase ULK4-like isoform X4 [Octopus vulgaris]|nr:serine/threonine-protein kinase ULK4-like isoform X4 [Octopus vulgaris]